MPGLRKLPNAAVVDIGHVPKAAAPVIDDDDDIGVDERAPVIMLFLHIYGASADVIAAAEARYGLRGTRHHAPRATASAPLGFVVAPTAPTGPTAMQSWSERTRRLDYLTRTILAGSPPAAPEPRQPPEDDLPF